MRVSDTRNKKENLLFSKIILNAIISFFLEKQDEKYFSTGFLLPKYIINDFLNQNTWYTFQ